MKQILIVTTLVLFVISSSSWAGLSRSTVKDLANVKDVAFRLTGAMDSSVQAGNDRDYFDVTITHCPINVSGVPGHLKTSTFLYVEQAISIFKDAPYRQRFVRLSPGMDRDTVVSSVYFPATPIKELVNMCDRPKDERNFSFEQLGMSNCSVFLKKYGNLWAGSTPRNGCPNSFGKATYATSEVTLFEDGMISWDQGWNDKGEQVWGATKGGYSFKKFKVEDNDTYVNAIAQRLSGFSHNYKQAEADPKNYLPLSFNNCPIKLENSPFPSNARAILIDQVADTPRIKFNRVRFLVVSKPKGELGEEYLAMTSNWAIKDKTKYHGLCNKSVEERVADANDITHNECDMYFKMDEKRNFVGGTLPGGCPSTYMGAERLEVEATLENFRFFDWERWYDKDGKLVAGTDKGPYLFELQ